MDYIEGRLSLRAVEYTPDYGLCIMGSFSLWQVPV